MAKVSDSRTRTVEEIKVYRNYRLSMLIEVDKDYSQKSWKDIVNEGQDRIDVYHKTGNNKSKAHLMAYDKMPKIGCYNINFPGRAEPRLYGREFLLEEVEISSKIVSKYDRMESESACTEFLDRLRDGNLLVDGYVYESKYGEWFVIYRVKRLWLEGKYWAGEWDREPECCGDHVLDLDAWGYNGYDRPDL